MSLRRALVTAALGLGSLATAQTFRRLGACPTLGCVFPPNQTDFLAGQYFDIRTEVHAPVNGSEAAHDGVPDTAFTLTITKQGEQPLSVDKFFNTNDSAIEKWTFNYFEDLFAQAAGKPSVVNVAAKAYRRVQLTEPGFYTATLKYYGDQETVAHWYVRSLREVRRTKNVVLFIGDGMTTNMITAARLIGHKQQNGRYQTSLTLDKFPSLGHQMTHSIDSFITDSANSANALYTGHKSTVNALGVYVDSSPDPFDDPKVESIAEIFKRITGGGVGIVSTAYIADATPAAFTAKTASRDYYPQVVDSFLNGATNGSWVNWTGPDVLFGGGAEQFYAGGRTYLGQDYYKLFADRGYSVVNDLEELSAAPNDKKALGIFCQSSLPVWLDRNIYKGNLNNYKNDPKGSTAPATNLPGLKEMTLKAIDILQTTHSEEGWFLMSEAASVDKQMHLLDYEATIEKLQDYDVLKETLIVVTADHGHGFDVYGSVDTLFLAEQDDDRLKRNAIGTYKESGESQYVIPSDGSAVPKVFYTDGSYFPANWSPRYTLAQGFSANPDRRENFTVHLNGPRTPATAIGSGDYYVNPADGTNGFLVNGTLPVSNAQGVHSLTDVAVYAMGPCQFQFQGTLNSIDIFFAISECLGLSTRTKGQHPGTPKYKPKPAKERNPRRNWFGEGNGEGWWESSDHWGF